jgi:hypothetical protein
VSSSVQVREAVAVIQVRKYRELKRSYYEEGEGGV